MANCNIESSLKPSKNKNAVAISFVAAFFCYFASESLLRQAAAGRMEAKGMSIDSVVNKLPEGIRDSFQHKIEISRLRTELENVTTPAERIFALIALGNASSEKDLEMAYAKVLDKYPTHPDAAQAYSYFLLAPKQSIRNVSLEQFKKFISNVPDTDRLQLWNTAYSKMVDNDLPPKQILDFFTHLTKEPPPFKNYKVLFIEIGEIAFLNKNSKLNLKCKELSANCDSLPTIEEVRMEREKKKREDKKRKREEKKKQEAEKKESDEKGKK